MLSPYGIYLLDFNSEAFIWVGKQVSKSKLVSCYKMASDALRAIHGRGDLNLQTMTIRHIYLLF